MNDLQTWTTEKTDWERGVGWVEEGKREKNWGNCSRINNKK